LQSDESSRSTRNKLLTEGLSELLWASVS
jgi:hypothetical protein